MRRKDAIGCKIFNDSGHVFFALTCLKQSPFYFSLPDSSGYVFPWSKQTNNKSNMHCGGGSTIRFNPIGMIFICVLVVVLIYFNYGGNNSIDTRDSITNEVISLKALLAVSIEMAKRGGVVVKTTREQVRHSHTSNCICI